MRLHEAGDCANVVQVEPGQTGRHVVGPRHGGAKALGKGLPVILVVNKTDRSDARIAEVVDETYELFMELLEDNGLDPDALEFPIVYSNGKTGQASLTRPARPSSHCCTTGG